MKTTTLALTLTLSSMSIFAAQPQPNSCDKVPGYGDLNGALKSIPTDNLGGFNFKMWGTIVDRDGIVCAVAHSGAQRNDQWPGSRVISAAKANTANAYSLPDFALSTANLYASGQPGGSLWGLQFSNPVNPEAAYGTNPALYGKNNDPMVGKRIGGQIVFGGGFALYNPAGELVGALGVSGDTSCKDHNFGWKVRHALGYDHVPAGVHATNHDQLSSDDNIIYDMGAASTGSSNDSNDTDPSVTNDATMSASTVGHVNCGLGEDAISQSSDADIFPFIRTGTIKD